MEKECKRAMITVLSPIVLLVLVLATCYLSSCSRKKCIYKKNYSKSNEYRSEVQSEADYHANLNCANCDEID